MLRYINKSPLNPPLSKGEMFFLSAFAKIDFLLPLAKVGWKELSPPFVKGRLGGIFSLSFLFDKFFNSQRICGLINLLLLNFYALLRAVLNKATHAARQSVLLYIAKYNKLRPKSAWEFVCRSAFSSRFPTPVKTG